MSWQPSNVKLPACATKWGEGPTVLYGMLVNMDRPLWRQSVDARTPSLRKLQCVLVLRRVNQAAWHVGRALNMGQTQRSTCVGNLGRGRIRCHRRDVMANSSHQIAERLSRLSAISGDIGDWRSDIAWDNSRHRPSTCCLAYPRSFSSGRLQRPSIGRVMMRRADSTAEHMLPGEA
ncbi:hypothetical protein CC86DRAFT_164955 [Ophiobolus disseminans]|uniref:Uncharacterized protein n=1 Tax=Ophiobolus disseminans TaxID=1469910 RepID=A0A6A7ABD3_9PLEO|nr:hypothetical protein CC86DRAFT_164955 [Ophiobolus disseminans]